MKNVSLILVFCILVLFAGAAIPANGQSVPLTITKTQYEEFNYSFNFDAEIGTNGMTLDSVVATDIKNRTVATAQVVAASPAPAIVSGTSKVVVRLQRGTPGLTYRIGVRVIDATTGERWEGEILLKISGGL